MPTERKQHRHQMRTEAQKRADKTYAKTRKQVPLSFAENDPDLALLERLADEYGGRKAAILAGLKTIGEKP